MIGSVELAASWTVLIADAARKQGTLASLDLVPGRIMLAASHDGHRYLMARATATTDLGEERLGRVVQLHHVPVNGDSYLAAVCIDETFAEVFLQLCAELVENLHAADDPAQELRQQLDRWRQLFSAARDPLSQNALAGLFGELTQLTQIIQRNGVEAHKTWRGPSGSVHDFETDHCRIEVKASTSRTGRRVSISSIEQLECPPAVDLYLRYFELRPDPTGLSVPAVIEQVVALGVSRVWLLEQLDAVGYQAVNGPRYEHERFIVRNSLLYLVNDESFPKLTSSSFINGGVPPGVASVQYSIDLTNSPPEPLPVEDEVAVEERML